MQWVAGYFEHFPNLVHSVDATDKVVDLVAIGKGELTKDAVANARHIVKCVNCHEELVALVNQLRQGTDFMKHDYDKYGAFPQENPWNKLFDRINATLAKARES